MNKFEWRSLVKETIGNDRYALCFTGEDYISKRELENMNPAFKSLEAYETGEETSFDERILIVCFNDDNLIDSLISSIKQTVQLILYKQENGQFSYKDIFTNNRSEFEKTWIEIDMDEGRLEIHTQHV